MFFQLKMKVHWTYISHMREPIKISSPCYWLLLALPPLSIPSDKLANIYSFKCHLFTVALELYLVLCGRACKNCILEYLWPNTSSSDPACSCSPHTFIHSCLCICNKATALLLLLLLFSRLPPSTQLKSLLLGKNRQTTTDSHLHSISFWSCITPFSVSSSST